MRAAIAIAEQEHLHAPAMEQPQYNLLHRERLEQEYAPLCENGVGTTIWSPLASDLLPGKYNAGVDADSRLGRPGNQWLQDQVLGASEARRLERARTLCTLAAELGQSPARLAIAWCLRNRHVSTVILGASRVAQLEENLGALKTLSQVDEASWARVEAATR